MKACVLTFKSCLNDCSRQAKLQLFMQSNSFHCSTTIAQELQAWLHIVLASHAIQALYFDLDLFVCSISPPNSKSFHIFALEVLILSL